MLTVPGNAFLPYADSIVADGFELFEMCEPRQYYGDKSFADTDYALTEREIQCLNLAASGKHTKEAAEILGVEPETVYRYYKSVKKKLNSRTLPQAVLVGAEKGYLDTK